LAYFSQYFKIPAKDNISIVLGFSLSQFINYLLKYWSVDCEYFFAFIDKHQYNKTIAKSTYNKNNTIKNITWT
jgi:hypothetical protein